MLPFRSALAAAAGATGLRMQVGHDRAEAEAEAEEDQGGAVVPEVVVAADLVADQAVPQDLDKGHRKEEEVWVVVGFGLVWLPVD